MKQNGRAFHLCEGFGLIETLKPHSITGFNFENNAQSKWRRKKRPELSSATTTTRQPKFQSRLTKNRKPTFSGCGGDV
jgi:hypothetical protein